MTVRREDRASARQGSGVSPKSLTSLAPTRSLDHGADILELGWDSESREFLLSLPEIGQCLFRFPLTQ